MKLLLSILGGLSDLIAWFTERGERQIGKQEQQNVDDKATIEKLEAEQQVAVNPVSSIDELRNGNF